MYAYKDNQQNHDFYINYQFLGCKEMQDIPEISLLKVRFRMWKGAGGFETLTFKKNDFNFVQFKPMDFCLKC